MNIIGWIVAAFLFLSPLMVSGLLVWQAHHDSGIVSLAEEEEAEYGPL
jgi:hypothetical protein